MQHALKKNVVNFLASYKSKTKFLECFQRTSAYANVGCLKVEKTKAN